MSCTAIVLAGSRPGPDAFAERFGVATKALIPLGGAPMIERPVMALLASKKVGDVVVLTQDPQALAGTVPDDPRIRLGESGATIAATMLDLCARADTRWPLLVTTADHALLDPATVDEFVHAAAGADIAIGVIEHATMMRRLPQTMRTWLWCKGGGYTGANLFMLRSPAVRPAIELWRSVEQDRKKAWRILSLLGPVASFGALFRAITLDQVMTRLSKRLGLAVRAVTLSNALAGVDVDKPEDHALAEAILAGKA